MAQGTYTGTGNRDIDYAGKAITLRSEDPTDPNVVDATIIDCQGTQAEPHRGFNFHSGEGANSILEGLTITNGVGSLICYGHGCSILKSVGGGIYCLYSGPTIRYCLISNNTAIGDTYNEGDGGSIYCEGAPFPTISNCRIINNTAMVGGGIYTEDYTSGSVSNILISNCIISGNEGYGGIYVFSEGGMIAIIRDCIIENNYGAGIYYAFSTSSIYNCTIANNVGKGIDAWDSNEISLINSIVWGHGGLEINVGTNSTVSVSYSNVQGGSGAVVVGTGSTLNWLDGNIDADPIFVDPNNGNYHLQNSSPCIDTGDPNFVPAPSEVDIDDDPRIIRGLVDMGADEFIPTCYAGPDYDQWTSVDYPPSWCYARQCHGDADNAQECFGRGCANWTRCGSNDIAILIAWYKVAATSGPPADCQTANPVVP